MTNRKHSYFSKKGLLSNSGPAARIILLAAAWFGSGLIPFAPGTFGSLAALPFAAGIYSLGFIPSITALFVIIASSIWISGAASGISGMKDPPFVVIDEAAGIFVTLFMVPVSWVSIAAGFVLFRFFDILKPFPVGVIDRRVRGGTGIVMDDVMAGVYANICVRFFLFLLK